MENLPEDHSPENIRKIFCEAGKYVTYFLYTFMIYSSCFFFFAKCMIYSSFFIEINGFFFKIPVSRIFPSEIQMFQERPKAALLLKSYCVARYEWYLTLLPSKKKCILMHCGLCRFNYQKVYHKCLIYGFTLWAWTTW